MYIVSQITPHEWRKASNCEHPDEGWSHDDEHDEHGHHHDHSEKESSDNHMMFCSHTNSLNSTDTYQLNEDECDEEVRTVLNENLFISDGKNIFVYNDELDNEPCECSTLDAQGQLELISYENNFNLRNSFWWAIATLIQQTTSDLYPKVFCFRAAIGNVNEKCVG